MKPEMSFEQQANVDIACAEQLGREGFRNGLKAPAQCKILRNDLMPKYSSPMGAGRDEKKARVFKALLDAWLKGFHDEHRKSVAHVLI